MKKNKAKKTYNYLDIIGILLIAIFISSASYYIYERVTNSSEESSSALVWCENCKTFHDKATADAEDQKLIWCINCNKYHSPDQE